MKCRALYNSHIQTKYDKHCILINKSGAATELPQEKCFPVEKKEINKSMLSHDSSTSKTINHTLLITLPINNNSHYFFL